MVEFSVRIDFYRDPKGPTDYVGSALRDGFTAAVLPRVGEYLAGVGDSYVWYGPADETGGPYAEVCAVEHFPTPAWKVDPNKPADDRTPGVRLVLRGAWPGDRAITGELPGPGEAMLRDYDAQGGWSLQFFSDHAPVEPFPGQPLMRSIAGRMRGRPQ
jgi:hypothetical protein